MAESKKVIDPMHVSLREKLAYSLGDIASNVIWSAASAFITYYYTNAVGVSAAAAGTIMLISRIFDGISDVVMGNIIDKTKSRFGKARPWLLWMAGPFALSSFLLFAVPQDWSDTGKVVYAFITYNLMSTVVYTAINISYGSMTALITSNQNDRTQLNIFRMCGAVITGVVANLLIIPLVRIFGNGADSDPKGWTMTFTMLGIIAGCLFLLCFLGTKERIHTVVKNKSDVALLKSLPKLFKNKYWVILLVSGLFTFMFSAMGVNPYYAQYYLNDVGLAGVMAMLMMIPMLVCIPMSYPFIKKYGKRNVVLFGLILTIPGYLLPLINPYSFVLVAIGAVVKGIGMGPMMACGFAMYADVIDFHEWKYGIRTEGLVYAAASFGNKVGTGLGAGLLGYALAWGGFDAAAATQSQGSMTAILLIYAILPLIGQVISIVLYSRYDLDKKYPQIMADLAERKKQGGQTK